MSVNSRRVHLVDTNNDSIGITGNPFNIESFNLDIPVSQLLSETTFISLISVLASEATLALIKGNTDKLDVNLSTRASETTVSGIKSQTDQLAFDGSSNLKVTSTLTGNNKVQLTDFLSTFDAKTTTFGELRTTDTVQLIGSTFQGNILENVTWQKTLTNNGTATVSNGELNLSTNTTANGSVIVNTHQNAEFFAGSMNVCYMGVRVPNGVGATNNIRRWGAFDSNNGMFWELNETTIKIGIRKAGVDTYITQGSWNGVDAASFVLNDYYHLYEFWYSQGRFLFYQDKKLIHTQTSTTTVLTATISLPIRYENTNINSNTTNIGLIIRSGLIVRLGIIGTSLRDLFQQSVFENRGFIVTTSKTLTTTELPFLLIINPSDSNILLQIKEFRFNFGTNNSTSKLKLYFSPTITNVGTTLTPINLRNRSITALSQISLTPTTSAFGTLFDEENLLTDAIFNLDIDFDLGLTLNPGEKILVTGISISPSTSIAAVNLVFAENKQ